MLHHAVSLQSHGSLVSFYVNVSVKYGTNSSPYTVVCWLLLTDGVWYIPDDHAGQQMTCCVVDMPRRRIDAGPHAVVHVTCDVTRSQRPSLSGQRRLPVSPTTTVVVLETLDVSRLVYQSLGLLVVVLVIKLKGHRLCLI